MSRRSKTSQVEAPGQDSFLDVVANLVGILIILVMVVGTQAKDAIVAEELERLTESAEKAPEKSDEAGDEKLADVESEMSNADSLEASLLEMDQQLQRQMLENGLRQAERDRLLTLVTAAEKTLEEHRKELSAEDQAKYDLESEMAKAKGELEFLSKNKSALQKPAPAVLQHLPTPMAKTVFGKEIQFRVMAGKVVYVPVDEMVANLKSDAQQQVNRLRDSERTEHSLPVIGGFAGRYSLRRVADGGTVRVQLEQLQFVQVDSQMGEPATEAMKAGSDFRTRIASMPPKATTVTLWTYPDSFDEFRYLKAELFKLGYLVAARPLPAGFPIAASPEGSRSAAE